MLPALARRAIETYSERGDLVVDPMCGIGTTVVEAVDLGRRAVGLELEPRWAALAQANLDFVHKDDHARSHGEVFVGDARELPRLLTLHAQRLLRPGGSVRDTATTRWIESQQRLGLPHMHMLGINRYHVTEVEAWLRERYGEPRAPKGA